MSFVFLPLKVMWGILRWSVLIAGVVFSFGFICGVVLRRRLSPVEARDMEIGPPGGQRAATRKESEGGL